MATKRPVFNHRPTDDVGITCDGSEHSANHENNEFGLTEFPLKEEFKDPKATANIAFESATEDENESMPKGSTHVLDTAGDIVDQILDTEDDPTEKALTFRTWFLGIGLSIFASVLQEIFYFKPQTIFVSLVFLTVIAYVLGDAMAYAIPRRGWFRYLNPHE
ncbi:hypothetical protein KCU80_g18431, partial [Aureobasidium melanogenum]